MRIQATTAFASIIVTFATNATASIITIGFDPLANGETVLEYYNHGFGGMGSGPGPDLSVSFSPDWVASPPNVYRALGGNSAAFAGTAMINFHEGWAGPTSFYYQASALAVRFYAGENASGSLVATLNLGPGDFAPTGLSTGITPFHSAVFVSSGARIDALTNGAEVIPEPGGLALTIIGLATLGLAAVRRRRW